MRGGSPILCLLRKADSCAATCCALSSCTACPACSSFQAKLAELVARCSTAGRHAAQACAQQQAVLVSPAGAHLRHHVHLELALHLRDGEARVQAVGVGQDEQLGHPDTQVGLR